MFFLSTDPSAPEQGPRVVLLQTLLRLNNIDVKINGIWDGLCSNGVNEYRARLGMRPGGPVDARVFFHLIQGCKLKVIDSLDAQAGGVADVVKSDMAYAGINVLLNERKPGHGVENAMQKIIKRSKDHKIGLLRMIGHGNRGRWISVAVGDPVHLESQGRIKEYKELEADWKSYIDYSHYERHRPTLAQVTPHFAKFGSVEIHSCTVGGRQPELIQKMADTWGVPVTAAIGLQEVGGWSREPKMGQYHLNTFAMEDEVITAYPNNSTLGEWAAGIESSVPNLRHIYKLLKQHVLGGK